MSSNYYAFSDNKHSPKNKCICLDTNFIYNLRIEPNDKKSEEYQIHKESLDFYKKLKKNKNVLYFSIFSLEEALHLLFKHYLCINLMKIKNISYDDADKIWHFIYKHHRRLINEQHINKKLTGFINWIKNESIQVIFPRTKFKKNDKEYSIDVISALPKIISKYKILSTDACILSFSIAYNISTFVSNDGDFLRFLNMDILGSSERKGKITVYMPTILCNRKAGVTIN